jgi:hypothetical protein
MDYRTERQIPTLKIPFIGYFMFIILFLASCKETTRPLELSDLKFNPADWCVSVYNNKEVLIANRVDTMFLIYDQKSEIRGEEDTAAYYVYDKNGRLLEMRDRAGWGRVAWNGASRFEWPDQKWDWGRIFYLKYDSIGLLIGYLDITDIAIREGMSYRFDPDSLLLYQCRHDIDDCHSVNDFYHSDCFDLESEPYFCSQFKFDKQGKILEEISGYTTIYKYNKSGQPIYKLTMQNGAEEEKEEIVRRSYFYTGEKLDSVVHVLSEDYGGKSEPMRLYYDERGLCYRQKCGNGAVINCVYKRRE